MQVGKARPGRAQDAPTSSRSTSARVDTRSSALSYAKTTLSKVAPVTLRPWQGARSPRRHSPYNVGSWFGVGIGVGAMLQIAGHPEASGRAYTYNLGGTEEVSVEELARRVVNVVGSDGKIRYVPYDEAYEEGFEDMQRRVPDTTRARELVGFEPTVVPLDDIIRMVADDQRG